MQLEDPDTNELDKDRFLHFWKWTFLPEILSLKNNPIDIVFKNKIFKMKQYCKHKIFAVFIMIQRIMGGGKNLKNY